MARLVLEISRRGAWDQFASLAAGAPPGSFSSVQAAGSRGVLLFTCHHDHSVIERSTTGDADVDLGQTRVVQTTGTAELARLTDGDSFEIDLQTDRMRGPCRMRFRHVG